ncbi:MAG: copper-translocating P-type ATPase [Clostridia bacterium]|nr:copper-translocating P-type ATPase [Clostridia bacterium]
MKKITLSVDGMTCSACSNGLEKYLNKQEGISKAEVNLIMNSVSIEYDDKKIKEEDLDRFIKEAGFKSLGKYKLNFEQKQKRWKKFELINLILLETVIFYISMGHMFGLPEIPAVSIDKNPVSYALVLFVLVGISLVFGLRKIKNGIKNLVHGTPNMDTLITIGVFASYFYSVYETFQIVRGINVMTYVHNLYYESAAMVIFFVELGQYIEHRNIDKTKEAIRKLVEITPKDALIIKDEEEKKVTIDEIKKGDIVLCKPGAKVAVDGEIISGETHINESFITGESMPVKKTVGMKVVAGSINYDGSIRYKAEKIGRESTVSEIVKMVAEASGSKAPIGRLADKISGIFVPMVILIAIIAMGIWYAVSNDISYSIQVFVTVLVVACPCSLGLATPLAIVVASGKCSQKGILVKSGEALENANKIKNILFDKTGTLTKGVLQVSKLFNYSNEKEEEIIKYIASIEKKSEHPIAKAIVNFAKGKKAITIACQDFKAIPGQGVYAKIKEDEFYIGNRKLVDEKHLLFDDDNEMIAKINRDEEELTTAGNSILFVVKNNEIVSLIGVKDIVREDSKELIKALKEKSINSIMLTGDNERTAMKIASEIEINEVKSNCSPKEKANIVKEYKDKGITAMCGDGINDSVSLVNADIGIAISNGTDISINSANVVLMNDNLMKIIDLINISKKTIKIIKQNLFWAFIYNICMIPIACGIFKSFGIEINPMIGSFAMMMSSIIVVLNSLRLKK